MDGEKYLLKGEEVVERLGISGHERLGLQLRGQFPEPLRLADGEWRWSWLAIVEWLRGGCPVTNENAYREYLADQMAKYAAEDAEAVA